MITKQQYKRLMSEYKKTGKITDSAMKADVDRHTARKYLEAGKCPAELQAQHTWRTRPDPLDKIWGEVTVMLRDAPELEAKTLFEHFLARPDSGLEESHLRTFSDGYDTGGQPKDRSGRCSLRRTATPASCSSWTGPTPGS